MKKLVILIAVLVLLFTGCGMNKEIENAQNLIGQIGTVTMESGASITAAAEAVAEIPADRQAEISNLDELKAAQAEYQHLNDTVEAAEEAIAAIGSVTLESGKQIELARDAYEAAKKAGVADYVGNSKAVLEAAEEEYQEYSDLLKQFVDAVEAIGTVTLDSQDDIDRADAALAEFRVTGQVKYAADSEEKLETAKQGYQELYGRELLKEIQALYEAGQYQDCLDKAKELNDVRIEGSVQEDCDTYASKAIVGLAAQLFASGDLEDALLALQDCKQNYSGASALTEFKELEQQIQDKLDSIRPANGTVLENKLAGGNGEFCVEAGDYDAFVKLEQIDNPEKYVTFYIRENESATVQMPDGSYLMKYTTGANWFGLTPMFGKSAGFSKAEDIMEFETTSDSQYIYYDSITVTLYTVWNGNMEIETIDPDEF